MESPAPFFPFKRKKKSGDTKIPNRACAMLVLTNSHLHKTHKLAFPPWACFLESEKKKQKRVRQKEKEDER